MWRVPGLVRSVCLSVNQMAEIVLSRIQAHVERVRTNCNHLDDIHFQEVYSRNGLINFILINVFVLMHI